MLLVEHWADSLYTRDYLRLTGAWADGHSFRAPLLFQEQGLSGRAFLADGSTVRFTVPRELAGALRGPGVLPGDER